MSNTWLIYGHVCGLQPVDDGASSHPGREPVQDASLFRGGDKVIMTRDQLVARVKRAGELEVSGEDQAETDSYFDTTHFRFHGTDGFEADYSGLTDYFKAI